MSLLVKVCGLIVAFAAVVWPPESLFQLNSLWITDQEISVKLENVISKPTLITLIYTHCTTACPIVVQRLKKLNALAIEQKIQLHIALLSMDTARDTPKRLNHFREEQKLSEKDWTLLSGKEDDVRALAVALGFSYQKVEGSDEIMHSNRMILVNEGGEIKETFDGVNQSPEDIIGKVKALRR